METNNEEKSLNAYKETLDMMALIASNSQSLDEIKLLTSSKVQDQLKVFLIAQARNELTRVIKLTQFLDKIESSFIDKANQAVIEDELTLKQYGDIIAIITELLARANTIISQVLKDDSLTTILNTTVYTNSDNSSGSSVVSTLKDAQSRERVRSVIQTILIQSEKYNTPDSNRIFINPEESEDNIDNG